MKMSKLQGTDIRIRYELAGSIIIYDRTFYTLDTHDTIESYERVWGKLTIWKDFKNR